ncbi:MAG: ComEC/Rec2 family competence protein [Isosphaeraceae bacterium]
MPSAAPNLASPQTAGDSCAPSVSMAPMALVLIALCAGIVIDRHLDPFETSTWITLTLASITVACLGLRRALLSSVALLAAILAIGGGWHHYRWNELAADDLSWGASEMPRPAWARGVIIELLGTRTSAGYGHGDPERVVTRLVVEITGISDGSLWQGASGRALVIVAGDRNDLFAGQPVELAGQMARVAGPLNPGEFDHRAYLRSRGIRLRIVVDNAAGISLDPRGSEWRWTRRLGDLRASCRARLVDQLDPRTAPLASALILGQREDIDPEVNDAFARTGTTHLLAISGLQIQVLAFALALVFRAIGLPRRLAHGGVALVTIGYAILVGLAPSVVRSAVMTLTFCVAAIVSRPTRSANTLAMAGLFTLAWNPFFLFDVGCQLSFLAIGALIWLVPAARQGLCAPVARIKSVLSGTPSPLEDLKQRYEPWWWTILHRVGAWIAAGVLSSAVVWLAALPLVALWFHLVSPIGILLNVPLIPLTSLALLLGAAGMGLGMVWSPLAALPIQAADALLRLTEVLVRWGALRSWGHRFVPGPSWGTVAAFYFLLLLATVAGSAGMAKAIGPRGRGWRIALWCAVLTSTLPGWLLGGPGRASATMEGELLAIGHGLAVVLQLPDGQAILYDCGRMGDPRVGRRIIAPVLWNLGLTRLNSVYLSHADQDHYNALPDLLDRFQIGELVIPSGFVNEQNPGASLLLDQVRRHRIPVRTIAAPATWNQGSTQFTVLHPPPDWHPETPDNARSLVLDVAHGGRHLLLTGDLDQLGLVELVAQTQPEPIDLMLAPHHGGKSANPSWLYSWARPRAVVVSQRPSVSGTTDALSPVERGGTPLLRTWERGAIHFRWSFDRILTQGFLDRDDRPHVPLTGLGAN